MVEEVLIKVQNQLDVFSSRSAYTFRIEIRWANKIKWELALGENSQREIYKENQGTENTSCTHQQITAMGRKLAASD